MNPTGLFFNPRRCYRGSGVSDGTANKFVGLYNASTAAELLVVWGWTYAQENGAIAAAYSWPTKIGAKSMDGQPIYTGQAIGPGQIFTGSDPASPTIDWGNNTIGLNQTSWAFTFPFEVLGPGAMLNFTVQANIQPLTASFFWQVCRPEEIILDTYPG